MSTIANAVVLLVALLHGTRDYFELLPLFEEPLEFALEPLLPDVFVDGAFARPSPERFPVVLGQPGKPRLLFPRLPLEPILDPLLLMIMLLRFGVSIATNGRHFFFLSVAVGRTSRTSPCGQTDPSFGGKRACSIMSGV